MIEYLRKLLLVRRCVCCREVLLDSCDEVFCAECRTEYENAKLAFCRGCGKPHWECRCAPPLLFGNVGCVVHLIPYSDELSRRLLYVLKRRNDRGLRGFLADELCKAIRHAEVITDDCDLAFAPRLPKNVKKYGFDHAKCLARLMGKRLDLPVVELFAHRSRSTLQKKLTAGARVENADKSYGLRRRLPKRCATRLILVDDVITTGSTMARLAELASMGFGYEEITVVCVARSIWKGNGK